MNTKTKRLLIAVPVAILLLLALTNPSYKDFKEFSADYPIKGERTDYRWHEIVRIKLANYFIYSVYKSKIIIRVYNYNLEESQKRVSDVHYYIAILDNYFEFKR